MKARTSQHDSARRKLQVRVARSAEPPYVSRAEWDFGACPSDELFECRTYEFARATAVVVEDVASLRKGVPPRFEDLVRALRERINRSFRVGAIFWYCPEFPDKPYLTIPIAERQRRLRTLWPGPASSAITLKPKIIPPDIGQRLARERLFYDSLELALFEIDWTETDTYLSDAFFNWLRENRPTGIKQFQTRGAGNFQRKWSDDLKALGAKRLLEKMGSWEHAFNETYQLIGEERRKGRRVTRVGLYSDREEAWKTAAKKAESLIAAWERDYTSNQID
jgi:hypothetical protein